MSTRRDFIRHSALATAAAAAGLPLTGSGSNVVTEGDLATLKWDKAPCRYCGTGCGVNVAVKDGRVVATHGDVHAEVNRGINCVKGYFLSKILYGADRLTKPLLRKKDGVYAKDGDFTTVEWDEARSVGSRVFPSNPEWVSWYVTIPLTIAPPLGTHASRHRNQARALCRPESALSSRFVP